MKTYRTQIISKDCQLLAVVLRYSELNLSEFTDYMCDEVDDSPFATLSAMIIVEDVTQEELSYFLQWQAS